MLLFTTIRFLGLMIFLRGVRAFSISLPQRGPIHSVTSSILPKEQITKASGIYSLHSDKGATTKEMVHSSSIHTSNLFKTRREKTPTVSNYQIQVVKQPFATTPTIKPHVLQMATFIGLNLCNKLTHQDRICDSTGTDDEWLSNLVKGTVELHQNMNEVNNAIFNFTPAWNAAGQATHELGLRFTTE
mmetsp:Transcript_6212/g.8785  ORF Transcript_6212/g.8785 Transcript_6212/m.8785 type:complete len:187 (+) Transcript_6212:59-619(+)